MSVCPSMFVRPFVHPSVRLSVHESACCFGWLLMGSCGTDGKYWVLLEMLGVHLRCAYLLTYLRLFLKDGVLAMYLEPHGYPTPKFCEDRAKEVHIYIL